MARRHYMLYWIPWRPACPEVWRPCSRPEVCRSTAIRHGAPRAPPGETTVAAAQETGPDRGGEARPPMHGRRGGTCPNPNRLLQPFVTSLPN